jgi:hypothetical protein
MALLVRTLSRALGRDSDVEMLKTIAIFCGLGLLVSLLFLLYGIDLNPGLF